MRVRTAFSTAFCIVVFLLSQSEALGCSCAPKPPVLDAFERAKLVVVTRVAAAVEKAKERRMYVDDVKATKMVVEKVYKGGVKVGDELTFAQGGGGDCVWRFDEKSVGQKFIFYLDEPSRGHPTFEENKKDGELMYYAFTCGRSTSLHGATDDLLYLDNLDKARGRTRLSGTLFSWSENSPSFAGSKVKIIGLDKTYETRTDKNGVYEIYDLPAGEYLVEPDPPLGWKIDDYWLFRLLAHLDKKPAEVSGKTKNQVPVTIKDKRHTALDLLFEPGAAR